MALKFLIVCLLVGNVLRPGYRQTHKFILFCKNFSSVKGKGRYFTLSRTISLFNATRYPDSLAKILNISEDRLTVCFRLERMYLAKIGYFREQSICCRKDQIY